MIHRLGKRRDPYEKNDKNACLLMGFVPLLTPSNLSHFHPCNVRTWRLFTAPWPAPKKMHQTSSNNEPRGPFQEISAKLPGWNGFLAVENGHVPGSIQLEVQTVATVENRSTVQWFKSWSFHIFSAFVFGVFWRFRTVWSQETDLKQNDSGPKMSLEAEINNRRIRIVLFRAKYLNPNI